MGSFLSLTFSFLKGGGTSFAKKLIKPKKGGRMNKILDVLNVSTWTDKNGKEQKSFTRCGVAFPRKDNKGYVLKLDVQNMTGDYILSQKKEWKES